MQGKRSTQWFEYQPLTRGQKAIRVSSCAEGSKIARKEQPNLSMYTKTFRIRSHR